MGLISPDISAYNDAQAKLLDRVGLAARSRFLALTDPGTRIHVLDAGSGDAVLFIHGGAGIGAEISPFGWRSRYDLAQEMTRVRVPTLLVWGDADAMWPIAHAERVAKALPNARLTLIRDAGHMPWIDQMDETSDVVRAFLVPAESV